MLQLHVLRTSDNSDNHSEVDVDQRTGHYPDLEQSLLAVHLDQCIELHVLFLLSLSHCV